MSGKAPTPFGSTQPKPSAPSAALAYPPTGGPTIGSPTASFGGASLTCGFGATSSGLFGGFGQGFGAAGGSPFQSPSFGSLAQAPARSGFGSLAQTPSHSGFGSSAQSTSQPGFGGLGSPSAVGATFEGKSHRDLLMAFFREKDPSSIWHVDLLLVQYQVGTVRRERAHLSCRITDKDMFLFSLSF